MVDKLVGSMVEEMARAMFDHEWKEFADDETFDQHRDYWMKAARICAAIAQKRVNELEALVEQMGGGCDANCGGLHSAMQQGREWFCPDCGLMLKRVAYVLPHVKPAVARAALPTMLKGNGDG